MLQMCVIVWKRVEKMRISRGFYICLQTKDRKKY